MYHTYALHAVRCSVKQESFSVCVFFCFQYVLPFVNIADRPPHWSKTGLNYLAWSDQKHYFG